MLKCEVREWVDVFHVQGCVARLAAQIGFAKRECSELAIVASELTSNILKYGVRGNIEGYAIADATGEGITLVAADSGPPFFDLNAALQDGWDDRGPIDPVHMLKRKGIGGGMGAVVRLTDSFRVEMVPPGKKVYVVRYLGSRLRRW